jgi:hypothetical protein
LDALEDGGDFWGEEAGAEGTEGAVGGAKGVAPGEFVFEITDPFAPPETEDAATALTSELLDSEEVLFNSLLLPTTCALELFDSCSRLLSTPAALLSDLSGDGGTLTAVFALSGISMGISSPTGLGWVSNTNGNPITAINTNTPDPINRCLTRFLNASKLSWGESLLC